MSKRRIEGGRKMANTIKVNETQMEQKKAQLLSYVKELKTQLSEMDTTERQLTTSWVGDASQAFDKKYKSDVAKIDNYITLINQYGTTLGTIKGKYVNAEKKNVQLIGK